MIEILSLITQIKRDIQRSNIFFPKLEGRLWMWVMYTRLTRKKASLLLGKNVTLSNVEIKKYQNVIDRLEMEFTAYLVLLAYDDPVDDGLLDKSEIYDQLARCLAGFIVGAFGDFPVSPNYIKSKFSELRRSVKDILGEAVWEELELLLEKNDFLSLIAGVDSVTVENLLYSSHYRVGQVQLNSTIFSAVQLGRTYRSFRDLLKDFNDRGNPNWHEELILLSLLKSGYAQANTIHQRPGGQLDLKQYVQIACWKSNVFLDINGCVRSLLVHTSFLEARFSKARVCEQVLDDIFDFYVDAAGGVLNFLSLRLIEQGWVAYEILSLLSEFNITDPMFIERAQAILDNSPLLKIYYEGSHVFHNPYFQAERDLDLGLVYNAATIENILREALVNSPGEVRRDIVTLLKLRADSRNQFLHYYEKSDWGACREVVEISATPLIFVHSFLSFARTNRQYILVKKYFVPQLVYYYLLQISLYLSLLKFVMNKSIIVWRSKIKSRSATEARADYENRFRYSER